MLCDGHDRVLFCLFLSCIHSFFCVFPYRYADEPDGMDGESRSTMVSLNPRRRVQCVGKNVAPIGEELYSMFQSIPRERPADPSKKRKI